jgi:23S rRNA U2552 (ribose-2'-O)-methylase RlmE/FtsJ
MKTWRECYFEPRQLVSDKWDHYFEIYDRYFDRYRSKAEPTYVEIGCQRGGSLETARKYFDEKAKIYGIDLDPACRALNEETFIDKVFIGDQSDQSFLEATFKEIGTPDIIVDDGSHEAFDVIVSFLVLFPKLADSGTYLIEDTSCAFYSNYRKLFYGLTVVDYFKALADKLSLDSRRQEFIHTRYRLPHAQRQGDERHKQGMLRDIWSIAFFDSIIVIEKAINSGEPLRLIVPPS